MLSVVMPLYNEERRLHAGLAGVDRLVSALGSPVELVLVDDGSTDGTLALAREQAPPGARVLAEVHRGKGGALAAGVQAATGDRLLLTDVDWSVAPEEIARLLAVQGDVVMAVREGPGAHRLGEPPARHLIGRFFNRLVQWTVMAGHEDTQCGCKVIERRAAEIIFQRMSIQGWAFDVELLVVAHALGMDIQEVPVTWRYESDTRVRPWRDSAQMARDVFHVQRRLRAGRYQ